MSDQSPPGAPTLYKPEYCEKLIQHMTQGLSFESFAGLVGVSRRTLYWWAEANPEFKEAKEIAWSARILFWERVGVDGITGKYGKNFAQSAYIFKLKNIDPDLWKDKSQVDYTLKDELALKLDKARKRRQKSE